MKILRLFWISVFVISMTNNLLMGNPEYSEPTSEQMEAKEDSLGSVVRMPASRALSSNIEQISNSQDLLYPFSDDGTWTLAMQPNDDGSVGPITLPFEFPLYGNNYTSVWINNNGNLSFDGAYYTYTATGFPSESFVMVAPFWADVDTRAQDTDAGTGFVWYKFIDSDSSGGDDTLVVTWDNVGYYSYRVDKLNTFQVAITDGSNPDIGLGNTVCFNYGSMEWTTGSASGGIDGFYGTPATVGCNRGNGIDYVQFGRFDHPGTDYDGPYDNSDGVYWLNGQVISMNTSGTSQNIPPVVQGFPAGGVIYLDSASEDSLDMTIQFLSPEIDQITTVTIDDPGNAQANGLVVQSDPGNVASVHLGWIPNCEIVGVYDLFITASDSFEPAGVTTVSLRIIIGVKPEIQHVAPANAIAGQDCSFVVRALDQTNGIASITLSYYEQLSDYSPALVLTEDYSETHPTDMTHTFVVPGSHIISPKGKYIIEVYDDLGLCSYWPSSDDPCSYQELPITSYTPAPTQYSLTAQVIGGNGTVAPTGGLYTQGDIVTLTATPAAGYAVKAWTGTNNDASTSNTNTVTMNGPRNVTVEFVRSVCQLTTAVDSGLGTIVPATGVHNYYWGEQVTMTAQPDTGWLVQSWVQDGIVHPTEATSYAVTMDTDKTVAVNFAPVPVTLTTAVIAGNGTIIPAPGQHIYDMGTTVEASAQPAPEWKVKSWTEDGVLHTTTDTTYSVVMDGDKNLDVAFEPEQYTLTTAVASGSGTINPAPGTYTYDSGTVVTVTAAPEQYSQVQSWTENGSVYTATDTSYAVVMNSDKTVAVNFERISVELNYDIVAGEGVIHPTSGLYEMGTTLPLSVAPGEGYCVRAWSGTNDDSSKATTNAVFMDSDKEVTVELAAVVDTEKCRITLGRSGTVGTLQVSGNCTATEEELAAAQAIYIKIWSPTGFDFPADPIDFDPADIKNGKYSYTQNIGKGDPADISSFKFDLNKGTFSLQIKNLDMAGMMNPIYADVEIGDYVGVAQICEDSIDGGYVPVLLSQGQADQLHSRKACVTKGKRDHSDTLVLLGDIALAQPDVDLTDVDVNITWCDQVFTIPAGSFKIVKGSKYKCTNADISPSGTATATIDLGAGTYSITLRKVSITQCQCCTATLGISFAEFNETVELHSQQAN